MIDGLNATYFDPVSNIANLKLPKKLSDGAALQNVGIEQQPTGQTPRYDKLELTSDQCQTAFNAPDKITIEIPRAWTIMGETFTSWNEHLQQSLDKADKLNLSFGERLDFLKKEAQKWVEDKRQNDPEMFAGWLMINKELIQRGEGHLVNLPYDFTMEDYNFYVKKYPSILA